MVLWVDDIRKPPDPSFVWAKSVNEAKNIIIESEKVEKERCTSIDTKIELIDLDHDAGDYYPDGGDYIRLLDWLEERGSRYKIKIHSMNPVGIQNMRAIIEKNKWTD